MRTLDLVAIAVSIAFGVTVTLWLAPLMWSDLRVAISSFVWPTTNATVIEHRITQFGGRAGWTYLAAAEFVYELSGQVHRGSEVLCECRSASDAADVLAKYPKGRVSIVSYDPARPSLAVLEPRGFRVASVTKWFVEILFMAVFMAVLPAIIWVLGSNKRLQGTHASGRP